MEELVYGVIALFLIITLTFALSPIIQSEINADIASSNHHGFTIDVEVLSALSVIVDLHGLVAIIVEIFGTIGLLYKSYLQ
ncbi:MAG: hypothetical protein OH338_03745 [Candidatus Parvarchaeota archaeon]|nr:hypothetical protein [Candidatus Parvarchaeum tengchongense]MCW1298820.1 hypothetical protein [Candidatus Parvarchaeum tengchongense]MCW1312512.1 hypothetical protein [Candidatus Parvarchaeum tengchongense]